MFALSAQTLSRRICSPLYKKSSSVRIIARSASSVDTPSNRTNDHKFSWAVTDMPAPSPGRGLFGRSSNVDVTTNEFKQKFERWEWLLKLLGYMNEDDRLFRHSNSVLQSCVNQSAIRDFYRALQLKPDFRGQQALLLAHVWIMHRRLAREGSDASKIMQELMFDRLWEETVVRLRFMNISELTVNKHLAEVQQHCFSACIAYDAGLNSSEGSFQEAIAKFVLANESSHSKRIASRMAEYMKRELKNLEKVDIELLMQGTVPWGPPPQLTSTSHNLKEIEEYTLIGEKIGNWRAALENRGKLYYWNLTTRMSVWDRPTGEDLNKGL